MIKIYKRINSDNGIKVTNEKNIITDEKEILGELNFEGYSEKEAIEKVEEILTFVEEAIIFNTHNLKELSHKLKSAFRLKHAVMVIEG